MPPAYYVTSSIKVRRDISALRQQAAGREAEFASALHTIYERLGIDPLDFGEPTFNYRHLRLTCFVAVIDLLSVEYCVDEHRMITYIRRVNLFGE